ncbi:MAG: hypothetical protein ACE5FU_03860 [Nitrospinota bacterium]
MISHTNSSFWKAYEKLSPLMKAKAREVYLLGEKNSGHNSLQFRQVHPEKPVYSVRIEKNHRVLGIRNGEYMIWFWIGSNDQFNELLAR